MKKKLYALTTLALLAAPAVCGAAEYWLGGSGAGDMDGTSEANMYPFASLATVRTTLITAGDTVHICGTGNRIDAAVVIDWTSPSGTEESPINIDGDCTDPGVVDARSAIPGHTIEGTWTNHSGNVWYMSTVWADASENVRRLWSDGVEFHRAETAADADVSKVVDGSFATNSTEHKLYVYSVGNPAITYTTMIGLQDTSITVRIRGVSYVNLHDISVYGGYTYNISYQFSNYCDLYYFNIKYGATGVKVEGNTSSPYQESSYIDIYSGALVGTDYTIDYAGGNAYDGINLSAANHCRIFGNDVQDYGHTMIQLNLSDVNFTTGCVDNEIYLNNVSALHAGYGRPFGVDGMPEGGAGGFATRNEFWGNIGHDFQTRSQINGYGNIFHHNLLMDAVNSDVHADDTAQGVMVQSYAPYNTSHDNLFFNNTYFNLESAAIAADNSSAVTYGHQFHNEVSINTGTNSKDGKDDLALYVPNQANTSGLTFTNCDFYNEGITNVVSYRGTAMDVATFNSADANSDVIGDNYQLNPHLSSTGKPTAKSPAAIKRGGLEIDGYASWYMGAYPYYEGMITPWNIALSIMGGPGRLGGGVVYDAP